MAHSVGLKF